MSIGAHKAKPIIGFNHIWECNQICIQAWFFILLLGLYEHLKGSLSSGSEFEIIFKPHGNKNEWFYQLLKNLILPPFYPTVEHFMK